MAKKITVSNNALLITDTVTSEVELDIPKRLVYYDLSKLKATPAVIQLRNIEPNQEFCPNIPAIPLADAVDSGDAAFTVGSFQTFARTNLGA